MAEQPLQRGNWVEIAIIFKELLLRNVQHFGFFFFYSPVPILFSRMFFIIATLNLD